MRALVTLVLLTACAVGPTSTGDNPGDASADSACEPDLALFTEELWEPVLERRCLACHAAGSGSTASESAFQLDADDLNASMQAAIRVADRILDKPAGLHAEGHGGGTIVDEGSAEASALSFWRGFVLDGECEPPAPWTCEDGPGPRRLRRLTHEEYDRTVQGLLGTTERPSERFAADDVVDGYHNDADALIVHDLLAAQYAEAAEALSREADLDRLLPCSPAADGRAACAARFIEDFGFKAFRRPLTQADVDRYYDLWASIAEEDGFSEGARWVVAAMLQSPHFLYRSELGVRAGDDFILTDWELASALSYTFWGGPPDDALLAAAASGELSDPDVLDAQITRLTQDPRAHEMSARFISAWLHLDRLETVSRAGIDPELRQAMALETHDLVVDVASEGGSLDDLMQARHSVVNARMADHYGLPEAGRVDLGGTPYGGLLTQASVLTTHGRHQGSSPVQRGVAVRERLLCEHLPPPPANIDASPPELDPGLSTREHYAQHASDPSCASCHDKIDPIGFAFEHFDELGRFREMDGVHEIDDSGGLDGTPFEGPFELADTLVDEPRFRACFVASWRRFATGGESCADDPQQIGLLDPLRELPTRRAFKARTGAPGEGDSLAVGSRIELELPDDEVGPDTSLNVEVSTNDWGGGYCVDISLTNEGSSPVTWSITRPVDGTVSNHWNSELEARADAWVFTGVEYNAELAPGATAGFGYCANRGS